LECEELGNQRRNLFLEMSKMAKKKRYNPLNDPLAYVPFVGVFIALYRTLEDEDEDEEEWEEEEDAEDT